MKKQLSLLKHVTAVAVAAGVCFAISANAQDRAPKADDPSTAANANNPAESPKEPTRVGSMAPIGQKPRKGEKADAAASTTTSTTAGAGQMSDADRQFMMMAAKDGMKEVHMGQMAAQQGQSDTVKKLGQQIAADHQKANQQLMAIATKKGIKPDTNHKMDKMSKREMANFDQAWIGMMVNDHQKDIAAYQRQAQQGADADLKAYAKKTLPVLQKHLKMVQAAQKKMGSGATNPAGMAPASGATKSGR